MELQYRRLPIAAFILNLLAKSHAPRTRCVDLTEGVMWVQILAGIQRAADLT